jgi:hypothetical protein
MVQGHISLSVVISKNLLYYQQFYECETLK